MDDADLTDERNEFLLRKKLDEARTYVDPLPANGYCHYCSAAVADKRKFCDAECAQDWHWEQQRRKQNR